MPFPLPDDVVVPGRYPLSQAHEFSIVTEEKALMRSNPSAEFHHARQPRNTLPGWLAEMCAPNPSALSPAPLGGGGAPLSWESEFSTRMPPPSWMNSPGPMLLCRSSCSKTLLLPVIQMPHDSWLRLLFCGTPLTSRPLRWIQLPVTSKPLIRQLSLIREKSNTGRSPGYAQ